MSLYENSDLSFIFVVSIIPVKDAKAELEKY